MRDLQENIVPAENQNKIDFFVYGKNESKGKNILFMGNSITNITPEDYCKNVKDFKADIIIMFSGQMSIKAMMY